MIRTEHLCKTFGEGTANPHPVLHDINLTIDDGDVFGIIGSSGAGKSTLVRCINLLERPTSGRSTSSTARTSRVTVVGSCSTCAPP